MASADQISCRNLGRQSWASAPTKGKKGCRNRPGQRRRAERLRRGCKGWVGIAAEIIPKVSSNLGQSLSQPAADSSLYTREPLGTGDADCRVGPAGLLAMTSVFCHSEERSDVGIRSFPTATAWAALSEAESAEREAGQIQSLPDDLRVQHGVLGSEVSARPRPCSRRDCDN